MIETSLWVLACIILLLVLSALLSLSETAFTALSKMRLVSLDDGGDARVPLLARLLQRREYIVAALLLGSNAVNILAIALATGFLVGLYGDKGVWMSALVMTVIIVIFSEIMPKAYALKHAERSALRFSRFVLVISLLIGPLARLFSGTASLCLRLLGLRGDGASLVEAKDETGSAVHLLNIEGDVREVDKNMLGGLLDLKQLVVSDVMIHRTKMNALDIDMPIEQLVSQALASPHTRMPLWQDEPDNIVGVLHVKKLIRALHANDNDPHGILLSELMQPPWFVPETTELSDQLRSFLKRKSHFALVVDEYGEVMGLVTLEDIIEEIVGDISDETDPDIQGVRVLPGSIVICNGSVAIRDLNRAMNWNLPDEEATTLAGLVIHEARLIPERGQTFTFYGYAFEVVRRERNRITRLRITPAPEL